MDWFNERLGRRLQIPEPADALPGRTNALPLDPKHCVLKHSMMPPFPQDAAVLYLGMGCFWGAERLFWRLPGMLTTAVGYGGGTTPNPTYEEVCSGNTGHTELVMVVFDTSILSPDDVLKCFWESHDPTQGMRQGNDVGTQYRSFLGCVNATCVSVLERSKHRYIQALCEHGVNRDITTEIQHNPTFYYAEQYHQQYLHKNPDGYCGLAGTGIVFPETVSDA